MRTVIPGTMNEFADDLLARAAEALGISPEELSTLVPRGAAVTYRGGDCLFHESAPRQWLGIVMEGEVEFRKGQHGSVRRVGRAGAGTVLSEKVMLDETPHSATGVALGPLTVWQIPRSELASLREREPAFYYRIVGWIARRLSDRLQASWERLAVTGESEAGTSAFAFRREHDSLGEREVPESVLYGVQTLRAVENFPFSGIRLSHYGDFVKALACVKKAAALANERLGVLDTRRAGVISEVCDEIIAGQHHAHFVVDMFQGGAGTSTNMNINEVIANRGLEILGFRRGEYAELHPNDHVNCSQSTNDVYPTAVKLGIYFTLRDTLAALRELQAALHGRAEAFADVLKMGRTENQDAVPMTLGQEFGAYAVMVGDGIRFLTHAGHELLTSNMGATAIGTGLNSPPGYAELCTALLAEISGTPVRHAGNLVEATQDSGEFALMSGSMKTAAVQLSKICNDLRWLSSGPRCGLYEIRLPAMQPGSSIMPGKVNPVIPEVVSQICYQIIGGDMTVSMAAEASELELNMAEPVIAFNLFFGLTLLRNAAVVLATRCIAGIEPNRERCLAYVQNSIGLVTALNPVLGYERSAAIASEALRTGASVYDLVIAKGWLSREQLDDLLRPEHMTHPRRVGGS